MDFPSIPIKKKNWLITRWTFYNRIVIYLLLFYLFIFLWYILQRLYKFGARKVALNGLGAIGCIPIVKSSMGTSNGSSCVDRVNQAVQLFNQKLVSLVDQLNSNFSNAKFIYVNSFGILSADPISGGIAFQILFFFFNLYQLQYSLTWLKIILTILILKFE